jgi:hypothetical protein
MKVEFMLAVGLCLVAGAARSQVRDGFVQNWSPVQIGQAMKKGIEAVEAARKNVKEYVKSVTCSLHPEFADIMKWRSDNQVDQDERALILKDSPDKFAEWFASDCVTGPRLSPTKHVLCVLKDKVLTVRYSYWSVNTGDEIQGFLKKYFVL